MLPICTGKALLPPGRCRAKKAGENTHSTSSNLEWPAWHRGTSGCASSFLMAPVLLYSASPSLSNKHSPWINTSHVGSETNGLNLYTSIQICTNTICIIFSSSFTPHFSMTFVFFLLLLDLYSPCEWSGMICLLTLKLWTPGKSDPFAAQAKHCIYEVSILKIYGNPITLDRSKFCHILCAKCS